MRHPIEHHALHELFRGLDDELLLSTAEFQGLDEFRNVDGGVDELKVLRKRQIFVLRAILLQELKKLKIASG